VPPPREAIGFARKRISATAVGSFLPQLTRKAFERYGFSAATLITDWATIVGRDMAAYTAPERLKWPRSTELPEDDAGPADKGRPGATLMLRVDGARALDVQYKSAQVIERINAYFGYAAVAELRIVQAPVANVPALDRRLRPTPAGRPLTQEVAGVADAGLRDALARLGAGVRSGR
jgi:hypothetical protein